MFDYAEWEELSRILTQYQQSMVNNWTGEPEIREMLAVWLRDHDASCWFLEKTRDYSSNESTREGGCAGVSLEHKHYFEFWAGEKGLVKYSFIKFVYFTASVGQTGGQILICTLSARNDKPKEEHGIVSYSSESMEHTR